MKKLFTLLFAACFALGLQAQLPDGSVAPNFTVTDLDGNEHSLYDLLDEGKSVFLDLSATWCPPCWNYHQTHALEDLYTQYGPDGTNEIMVLHVEADPTTPVSCLTDDAGCPANATLGDWTAGTSYPIADDASVGDLYALAYYPTIYHICPNRLTTEIGQQSTATLYNAIGNCASASGANNAGLLSYDGQVGTLCVATEFTPEVTVQNLGTEDMTSVNFEVMLDGTSMQTMEWTGNLQTFGTDNVAFDPVMVQPGSNLEVMITGVNGVSDEDTSNDAVSATFPAPAQSNETDIVMEFRLDAYAFELAWHITNEAGDVVAQGGNQNVPLSDAGGGDLNASANDPGAYPANAVVSDTISLPAGVDDCYTITLWDDYGDGVAFQTQGTYWRVKTASGETLIDVDMDGLDWVTFDDLIATSVVSSVPDLATVSRLNVFPNPVQGELNVQFDLAEAARLDVGVYNALGQRVATLANGTFTTGTQTLTFETSNLNRGVYFLQLTDGERLQTRKFTVLGQ